MRLRFGVYLPYSYVPKSRWSGWVEHTFLLVLLGAGSRRSGVTLEGICRSLFRCQCTLPVSSHSGNRASAGGCVKSLNVKFPSTGLCVWTLGPQLGLLVREVMEPLGGRHGWWSARVGFEQHGFWTLLPELPDVNSHASRSHTLRCPAFSPLWMPFSCKLHQLGIKSEEREKKQIQAWVSFLRHSWP